MRTLPKPSQAYIGLVSAAGLALVGYAVTQPLPWITVAVLALFLLVFESASAVVAARSVHVSVGFSVALGAAVLVGPLGGAVVGGAAAFCYLPDQPSVVKRLFNAAQFVLGTFAAGSVYGLLVPGIRDPFSLSDFPLVLGPYAAAALTYVLVNGALVTGVLWLAEGLGPGYTWREALRPTLLTVLGHATCGLVLAALWQGIGPLSALLVLVPLLVARWALEQHAHEQAAYNATISALCKAVETKDFYTRGHCERVAKAALLVARELGMRESRITNLHYAAIMHDVGKLGVPTQVLQKNDALTDEEFAAIQLHPTRGVEIVRDVEFLGEARAGIAHHHERIDGRGYPSGLSGAQIPEFARVIAVADAFDCMTSTRSYRAARSPADAIGELQRHAGTQFDPAMVDALVRAVDEHGWKPHEPVAEPGAEPASAGRDHDDPGMPLPATEGGSQT